MFALSQIGPQGGNLSLGSEAAAQQTIGMELSQPACITHVHFAARPFSRIRGLAWRAFTKITLKPRASNTSKAGIQ